MYDEAGNRVATTDANGHTTTFAYDSLNRLISTTDAENQTTTTTYDASGNRLSVTDPEGNTTRFSYDSLNRLIQTTNALSGTNSVTYDALGNRLTATDANGHPTTFTYDDLNRVTQTTDPNNLTTVTAYDGLGNRLSLTNAAGETTSFVYDNANRLIQITNPQLLITNYQYDGAGNRVAMIDAEGIETRYQYDDLNRLAAVIENYVDGVYDPNLTDEDVKTQYTYDANGNRLTVTDANNHTTGYVYDDLNRRAEMRDPLNNATTYGYDAVGNRTRLTGANGETTNFIYDDVNRLTTIDYPTPETDVSFNYDQVGNRLAMIDGTGATTYTYDSLYRLTGVNDGAGMQVGYAYDAAGNRTQLVYPNGYTVTYAYDPGNRLQTVADWQNGQYGYNYDQANRLTGLSLPIGITSSYSYDAAGRLLLLTHDTLTETLASYSYSLDKIGNRRTLAETLVAVMDVPGGAYLENGGLVVMEAENGTRSNGDTHNWLLKTTLPGYTGTSYLQSSKDTDSLVQTDMITTSPRADYLVNFTTAATYTVWVRGYAPNAAGDSAYVSVGNEMVEVTGFAPREWDWASLTLSGAEATLPLEASGTYTVSLWMREDGLRIDRLLLTTDTTYVPVDVGPVETARLTDTTTLDFMVDRKIDYGYDNLYRLTSAAYSTGESYAYEYDPVGNRLQQIINGDTTSYLYDAANRLAAVDGQVYTFDANGNLLSTGVMTNTWDTANRLINSQNSSNSLTPIYNGVSDRVGQTVGTTTTYFALDVQGLPEVIYTSDGEAYLHLPGVIMAESASGEVRYLLGDGLGSVRQAVDENGEVVAYNEFDPYGNPTLNSELGTGNYGFTGEWREDDIELLHLRARWYLPETGTFLSRDPWEGSELWPRTMNGWSYVVGNPINLIDPSGRQGCPTAIPECSDPWLPIREMWETGERSLRVPTSDEIGVDFWRWAYDKRNPLWRCDVNSDGLYNKNDDDGQHASDTWWHIVRDFVCEYGPQTRYFTGQDQATQNLRRSSGIWVARREFYLLGKKDGARRFGLGAFIAAWVDLPVDGGISHILGGYSYDIKRDGPWLRFHVTNDMTRQSGSRIPNQYEGPSVEEMLIDPTAFPPGTTPQSYLKPQRREATIDPVGGGNMRMEFFWHELYQACQDVFNRFFAPPPPASGG